MLARIVKGKAIYLPSEYLLDPEEIIPTLIYERVNYVRNSYNPTVFKC